MKSNELRIGNWVQRLDGSKFKVSSSDLVIIENIKEQLHPKPIPLTTEVLEKCGFEKSLGVYVIDKACIFRGLSKINIYIKEYDTDYEFTCPEYLHQLQNLYFALTGEELQYTP